MKSVYQMAFAGAAGLILGATGMNVLHAQTATPQAYLISNIMDIKDPDTFKKYQSGAPPSLVPFGGHAIVRGATAERLDKTTPPKGTIVILAFPSMKNLKAWWTSPAYAAVRPFREGSTTWQLYAVEGVPPS